MNTILMIMNLLMAIPLLTLFERKMLSYSQNRKGPNKVSIGGILQPISDGIKLVLKNFVIVFVSKKISFLFLPFLSFLFMCFCWKFYPFFLSYLKKNFSLLVILCISSLSVYMMLFSGWASNSKYSLIGSIRGAAQNISYEMSLIMVMLTPCCLALSLNLNSFLKKKDKFVVMVFPLFVVWLIKCIAELNRAPFDFAEGESELVSGFKTEYSALNFAFFFLGEYGMILFLSFLTAVLFICDNFIMNILFGSFFTFLFVLIRASFPRLRYDLLKFLAWKLFLPMGMLYLMFLLLIK